MIKNVFLNGEGVVIGLWQYAEPLPGMSPECPTFVVNALYGNREDVWFQTWKAAKAFLEDSYQAFLDGISLDDYLTQAQCEELA